MRLIEAVSPEERERYQQAIYKIIQNVDRLDGTSTKAIVTLLQGVQAQVKGLILDTPSERWAAWYLPELLRAIETRLNFYRDRLQAHMRSTQEELFDLSVDDFNTLLRFGGYSPIHISRNLLAISQSFSADLITNLTTDALQRINRNLLQGIVAGWSPFKTMGEVGRNLKDPSTFKTIADRAETIVRTETLRVYSMAHQASLDQASRQIRGLKKKWVSTLDARTRADHISAHNQIVLQSKPFVVGGEQLQFPRDPAGSGGNTINCRCVMVAVIPGYE